MEIHRWSPIVELRQYTLRPGRRDELIEVFDANLVESQEDVGMKIIGQFRDLDAPDRFVWVRGFPDMETRAQSLAAFYGGPVWKANSTAANATMLDVDDVLLLRPARPDSAFALDGDRVARGGFVSATVLSLEAPAEETEIVPFFEETVAPRVEASGASILGRFVTEPSENTFPSLPVREGENVFVWFAGFTDRDAIECADGHADDAPGLTRPPHVVRLEPTSRSLLHGRHPARQRAKETR